MNQKDKHIKNTHEPLAARMRPRKLEEFVGQSHLLAKGKPLRYSIEKGLLHSMILWGPPGTGKTTLAFLMAKKSHSFFQKLSAISAGVKEIREVVEQSRKRFQEEKKSTILFIDEIHRFNKAQQDVLLPFVEDGTFVLIGATTENPSFELTNALLSRVRVYVLKSLSKDELLQIIDLTIRDQERGLGYINFEFPVSLKNILVEAADGDARQILNLLEILADLADSKNKLLVTEKLLSEVIQLNLRRFDKQGEAFYDQISALHKSVRGSSPDAALYWLARMLDGGCDPRYIARRMIRMAIEDIGLADPRGLQIALHTNEVYERLGSPEGELALAEGIVYLACAPKSNAIYIAFNDAVKDAKQFGSLEVPLRLRNAPTQLMKKLNYGKEYRYAHNESYGYAAGENYFPDDMTPHTYYFPKEDGLEIKIKERLAFLKKLDEQKK